MDTDSGQQMKKARIPVFLLIVPLPAKSFLWEDTETNRWVKKLFIMVSNIFCHFSNVFNS